MTDWYQHRPGPAPPSSPRDAAASFPASATGVAGVAYGPGVVAHALAVPEPGDDHCAPGLELHQFRHRGDP